MIFCQSVPRRLSLGINTVKHTTANYLPTAAGSHKFRAMESFSNSDAWEKFVFKEQDEDVTALVHFILDKVTEEVWKQVMTATYESSNIMSSTDQGHERDSLLDATLPKERTHADNREFRRQVHRYVQDIIISAIDTVAEQKGESDLITRSDHKILLRSFADPEPDVTNFRPKFVIPTISIELVDDECPSGTDDIEDELVDDLVNHVLAEALDDVLGDIRETDDVYHVTRDGTKHGDAELWPCTATLKLPAKSFSGESDRGRSPRRKHLNVKRLLGFRRRSYKLQPSRNGPAMRDTSYEPISLHSQQIRDDRNSPLQVVVQTDKPDGAVTESVYTDVDTSTKRTKAFSRRMFNRIFGSRQLYSPLRMMNKTVLLEKESGKQ